MKNKKEQVCESLKNIGKIATYKDGILQVEDPFGHCIHFKIKRRSLIKASPFYFLIMAFSFWTNSSSNCFASSKSSFVKPFAFQDDKVIMTALYWIRINGW